MSLVSCALINQTEDKVFTAFLLSRNSLHLLAQWQIKTCDTQKLETIGTAQQGCFRYRRAAWPAQDRYLWPSQIDPLLIECHWLQTPLPLMYKGEISKLGLQTPIRKITYCSHSKEARSGSVRKVSILFCPVGFGKPPSVTSEHCARRVHTQSTDLHVPHTYKSCWELF